ACVRAVTVAIGLDDRAELGAAAQGGLEDGAVVFDGPDVDPGHCPRHGYSPTSAASASARVTMPARRPSASTTGRWLWCLSAIFFATESAPSPTPADTGSGVIRSRTLVAKALFSLSSNPFIEPTQTIPPMMFR